MRTILNFEMAEQGTFLVPHALAPATEARPPAAPVEPPAVELVLFASVRQTAPRSFEWRQWSKAGFAAALVHVAAAAAFAVAPSAPVPQLEEPRREVVFFSMPPPPAPVGRVQPKSPRAPKVQRELVAPAAVPVEVPEEAPAPQVEEPAEVEAVADAPEIEGAELGGVPGGVAGGLVGSTGEALSVSELSRAPGVSAKVVPRYPSQLLKRDRIEGTVLIRIVVGLDGAVEPGSAQVLRSVHPALDAAALEAVHGWRFTVALGRDGRPVRSRIDVPFAFSVR